MYFSHSYNTRDLGGLTNAEGNTIPFKVFLRSDFPEKVSQSEKEKLLADGITTILDFRSLQERERKENPFRDDQDFALHYCPMFGGEKVPPTEEEIPYGYLALTKSQKNIKEILTLLARAPKGVLFHCSAGKDRTGIVAALLLMFAKVPDESIIKDYEVSYENIRIIIDDYKKSHPELPSFLGFSKPEYMQKFLELFRKEYGDIESYFLALGLEQEISERLRIKLGVKESA